jgi:hypothetical protein
MKRLIGVVGFANAGKSTVIQSLTGCPTKTGIHVVADRLSSRSVLVFAASPQENSEANGEFESRLRRAGKDPNNLGVVVAIQPTLPTKRLGLEDMVRIAKRNGFAPHLFVLEPPHSGRARRVTVRDVQTRVGRVKVQKIDGRRFAHLSAREIAKSTHLF